MLSEKEPIEVSDSAKFHLLEFAKWSKVSFYLIMSLISSAIVFIIFGLKPMLNVIKENKDEMELEIDASVLNLLDNNSNIFYITIIFVLVVLGIIAFLITRLLFKSAKNIQLSFKNNDDSYLLEGMNYLKLYLMISAILSGIGIFFTLITFLIK
ncbi:MAG: hypothetical protein MH132_06245 [Hydrotalea sp.]|nr:hypothetical protein [Hydrotalea sp.]